MTLEDLKNRCESEGFKYAYGVFKEIVEPPHLLAICVGSNNFMADNKVYKNSMLIKLDYTYIDKDVEQQSKIENIILSDIAWNKGEETYLENEEIFQTSYFFEL